MPAIRKRKNKLKKRFNFYLHAAKLGFAPSCNFNTDSMKVKTIVRIFASIIISIVISTTLFAKGKDFNYLRDGISFSIPEGWKVIANDSIGDNAYYFSAERTGNEATGLITAVWINKVEEPKTTIALHQKTMKAANMYRNPGIEFTAVIPDNFAGLKVKVVSCRYSTIVKGLKLDGMIYCFNSAYKTISIFFQSGPDDQKLNQKAFDLVRQTFNCRE